MKISLFRYLYLTISIALIFPIILSAQATRLAGSASKLEGKIYILSVFISENEWEYTEKKALYDTLYAAEQWLSIQAKKYGKHVSFEGGNFGLDKTLIIDNIHSGNGVGDEPVDLVSVILKKIGYNSPLEFHQWVLKNTTCTQAAVIFFANKPGRGYAMAYENNMSKELYFVEGAILYKKYQNGHPLCAASIAHEFLHLFGANDLYETFETSKAKELLAKKIYPNDIMLRTSYNIHELEIGALSAWLIGLSDKIENDFDSFLGK